MIPFSRLAWVFTSKSALACIYEWRFCRFYPSVMTGLRKILIMLEIGSHWTKAGKHTVHTVYVTTEASGQVNKMGAQYFGF